jgi:pilus assembly protein CpaE
VKSCIIICPDTVLAEHLEASLEETGALEVNRTLISYPTPLDLVRTLRAAAPDVIFLAFDSAEQATEIVKVVEGETPGIQVISIAREANEAVLRESMRVGIREFLSAPFERSAVREALEHVFNRLEERPTRHDLASQIFTFMPSKAGVGASTIALNVSAALARSLQKRVLLTDFDLNSGMMRFLLKLENNYSVVDAVNHSITLDEHVLPQLVTSIGKLDVIHAGRMQPNLRVESGEIRSLVDFMRRNYEVLCFDVSGNLERYSLELMRESRRVLLVCTQEIPSLHLAREKMAFLRQMDLESRVTVLLNRCYKRPTISRDQVEELLGVPVVNTFPNDYNGVTSAMTHGTWVKPDSELGKSYQAFAGELMEMKGTPEQPKEKKRFLEFFSVAKTSALTVE